MAEDKIRSTFGRLLPEGRKKKQNEEQLNESQLDKVNGGLSAGGKKWLTKPGF